MADSSPAPHVKERKGFLSNIMGKGKSYWVVAIGAALAAVFLSLTVLGNAASTTTVYVLGQDVAARTRVTPDMLVSMVTSQGGQPRNALDIQDVTSHAYFTKVALRAGDVVSPSNVGPLERITTSLPDGFVAASFSVTAQNAVAGKVAKGDYIDLIAKDEGTGGAATAKVVLHRVLVLDVTVSPENIAAAANSGQVGSNVSPESKAMRTGIPSLYTVGLSAQDAAKLALVRDKNLFVVLAANNSEGSLDAAATMDGLFGSGAVANSSAGIKTAAPAAQPTAAPAPASSGAQKPSPSASN